jgi:hypothetical protein
MKRILLAAVLCATSAMATAQQPAPEIPGPKCEPKPQRPGESLLSDPRVRRQFERDVKLYTDCMVKYIEERKTVASAHHAAANAAIAEYNKTVDELNPQKEGEKGSKSGPGTSLNATPPRQGN